MGYQVVWEAFAKGTTPAVPEWALFVCVVVRVLLVVLMIECPSLLLSCREEFVQQ